ncbi:MAG: prepilin-type N-terminal cleavage/methylation domain-containing protein [Planctomycetes bacterium]|nr:prepilin-type N-terminal cleavage/methylation domain-containing protein [Planctomycetota bacterium]
MKRTISARAKKGFTLIELAIVMVMAAILASVAMPIYLGFTDGAKWSEAITATSSLKRSVEVYKAGHSNNISGMNEGNGLVLSFDDLKLSSAAFTTLQFFDAVDFILTFETDGTDGEFIITVTASGGGLSNAGPQNGTGFYRSLDKSWNGSLK